MFTNVSSHPIGRRPRLTVVHTPAVAAGSGTDTDLGPAAGFGSASHRIPGAADELRVLGFPRCSSV